MSKHYKIKTKKAIQKRFSLTGSGKIKCLPSGIRHRLISKSSDRKRDNVGLHLVHKSDVKRIKKYVYSFIS